MMPSVGGGDNCNGEVARLSVSHDFAACSGGLSGGIAQGVGCRTGLRSGHRGGVSGVSPATQPDLGVSGRSLVEGNGTLKPSQASTSSARGMDRAEVGWLGCQVKSVSCVA